MKKIVAGLFACAVVLGSISAFASDEQDVYFGSDKSVHIGDYNGVNGEEYTTVLIRKTGTTDASDVVYVDQNSDGLGSVMNFMLKDGVEENTYTATFGNSDGDTKTINFKVGDVSGVGKKSMVTLDQANKMLVADEPTSHEGENFTNKIDGDYYKKSFILTTTMDDFGKFNSVYIVLADGTGKGEIDLYDSGALERPSFTGDGEIAFGIQIYNIPKEYKGMNLYLGEASK